MTITQADREAAAMCRETPWNAHYGGETLFSGTWGHISRKTSVRASVAAIRNLAGEE